jgi:hypothetical protein
MYQDNDGQSKSSEELSLKTSLLVSVLESSVSGSAADPKACHPNQETDQQNTELQDDSSFCTNGSDQSFRYVDGTNLNRDKMPPWTIIVTRAELVGHGQVPSVESTNMGQVKHFSLSFFDGELAVDVDFANRQSVMQNNPEFRNYFHPEPQRIEVGAWGRRALFEHDFDKPGAMYLFGKEVLALFVEGGISEDAYASELVGPMMIVVFKDETNLSKYLVDYVHLECKPVVTKSKYFQVCQKPGHHHDH